MKISDDESGLIIFYLFWSYYYSYWENLIKKSSYKRIDYSLLVVTPPLKWHKLPKSQFLLFIKCVDTKTWLRVKPTFNNISVISWRSVLLLLESGEPWENHRPVGHRHERCSNSEL